MEYLATTKKNKVLKIFLKKISDRPLGIINEVLRIFHLIIKSSVGVDQYFAQGKTLYLTYFVYHMAFKVEEKIYVL